MQNTMKLLADALAIKPIPEWTRELGLSAKALYTARDRGHLSPAIAGDIADRLGKDAKEWIVIAALESDKDSACKQRMLRKWAEVLERKRQVTKQVK